MAKKNVRADPSKTQVTENPQMSDIVLVLDKMELLIQAVSEINKNGKYSTVPAEPIHQECTSLQERVSAIETLLDGKILITGAPVQNENGYDLGYVQVTLGEDGKLTTSNEQTISINHGITPEFNVTVGPDPENPNNGKIYWLINGKPMLDASGNPVEAPKDGAKGEDAPTPVFHIWDGVLCYTFDENPDLTDKTKNTWYELQNVIGPQGPVGPQGPSGLSITTDENGKVTITYDHDADPQTPAQTAELPTYSDFMELYNQVQDIQASINGISTLVGLITGGEDGTPQEFITDYRPIVDANGIITGFQFQTVKYVQNAEGSFEVVASGTKTVQGIGELISLEQDAADGKYYWVLPDDTKLPVKGEDGADAAQPKFCIVNGHLWYTLDENPGEVGAEGHKWQDLGSVAALLKDGSTDTNTNKSLVTITIQPATDGKNEVLAFTFGTGKDAVTIEVPTQGAFEELLARVAALETKIKTLEKLVEAADNKINSLAGTMRVIHSFEKITDNSGKILKGFRITWKKYEPVTDANGNFIEWKPVIETETEEYRVDDTISLTQDESGNWYWVINSFDSDGNVIESVKIPFETEPQLKVIDGILYVALVNNPGSDYNDPTKWMRVQMPKESASQQSLISIEEDGDYVVFTFAGTPATVIKVPSDAAYKKILSDIATLNSNLANLQKLVDEINARAYVVRTEPYTDNGIEKGQYIVFSDGKKVLIKYGEKGDKGDTGITPKFKINNSGYWMVSYDDGQNYNPVTNQDGDFVRATPKLRIYNGYWQVSYNINGADSKWDYLLDDDGNQIPASGADGDTVFAENPISAGEDKDGDSKPDSITITLADGTTYTIPIWDAFVVLKNQVEEINTTVSTFSRLLSGTKFIQNIAEFTETADGKTRTGIAVTYVSYDPSSSTGLSDPVTEKIYNGSVIGIIQDPTDGKYYWTIDGDYLLDENRNKVLAKGEPGADAPIPSFSISQDGHLMMTVTINGVTTTEDLGDVTGESGSNGAVNITWDGKGNTPPVPAEDAMSIKIFYGEGAEDYIAIPTQKAFIELQDKVTALEGSIEAINALFDDKTFVKDIQINDDGFTATISKYDIVDNTIVEITEAVENGETVKYPKTVTFTNDNLTVVEENGKYYLVVKGTDIKIPLANSSADTFVPKVVIYSNEVYLSTNAAATTPYADIFAEESATAVTKGYWIKVGSPITGSEGGNMVNVNKDAETGKVTFEFTSPDGQKSEIAVPTYEYLKAIETRVTALEQNVSAIQALLRDNQFVKDVEYVYDDNQNIVGVTTTVVKYVAEETTNSDGKTVTSFEIQEQDAEKITYRIDDFFTIRQNASGDWEWVIKGKGPDESDIILPADGSGPRFVVHTDGSIYVARNKNAQDPGTDPDNWLKLEDPIEGETAGSAYGTLNRIEENNGYLEFYFEGQTTPLIVPTQETFQALADRVVTLEANVDALETLVEESTFVKDITTKTATDSNGYEYVNGFDAVMVKYQKVNGVWTEVSDRTYPKTITYTDDKITLVKNTETGAWEWKIKTKDADGPTTITLPASGGAPRFELFNGRIYVAIDPRATTPKTDLANDSTEGYWRDLGLLNPGANVDGGAGNSLLSVDTNDNGTEVTFKFTDGTEIVVPTQSAFEDLNASVAQLNDDVKALQDIVKTIQEEDYVTRYEELKEDTANPNTVTGIRLHFKKGGSVDIDYGKDGVAPEIGVTYGEDGILYWTIGGQPLYYPGTTNPVPASYPTPIFDVTEDGELMVSYNNGSSWDSLGKVVGEQGDSMFKNVELSEDGMFILVTLSDDVEYKLPIWQDLVLQVNATNVSTFTPGSTQAVPFTITGPLADGALPEIATIAEGKWIADVRIEGATTSKVTGKILITAPSTPEDLAKGKVIVFASLHGQTVMKVINVSANSSFVQGGATVGGTNIELDNNNTLVVDYKRQEMVVRFTTTAVDSQTQYASEYSLVASYDGAETDWILENNAPLTRSTEVYNSLVILANTSTADRSATISVIKNGRTGAVCTFKIKQTGVDFDLTPTSDSYANCFVVSKAGSYVFSAYDRAGTRISNIASREVIKDYGTSLSSQNISVYDDADLPNGIVIFEILENYFVNGNAVIVAKNPSGTIVWSWHIWMRSALGNVSSNTMMDMNLGAFSAGEEGLYYQWGRKDPLTKDAVSSTGGTVQRGIENPTVFYEDWLDGDDFNYWSSDTYNPCPSGYTVPATSDWATNSAGTRRNETPAVINGLNYYYSGFLYPGVGLISSSGTGYLWSSTNVAEGGAYALIFNRIQSGGTWFLDPVVYRDDTGRTSVVNSGDDQVNITKSFGMNIRCIKE